MVGKMEIEYQADIISSCRKLGGYGFKLNNRFLSGIPDLFLSHASQGPVIIEVKVLEPGQRTILVSPIQSDTLERLRLSGTRCGVAAIRPEGGGEATIFMTHRHNQYTLDDEFVKLDKERGKLWPVLEMMKICKVMQGE